MLFGVRKMDGYLKEAGGRRAREKGFIICIGKGRDVILEKNNIKWKLSYKFAMGLSWWNGKGIQRRLGSNAKKSTEDFFKGKEKIRGDWGQLETGSAEGRVCPFWCLEEANKVSKVTTRDLCPCSSQSGWDWMRGRFCSQTSGFESFFLDFLAGYLWTNYLTSLASVSLSEQWRSQYHPLVVRGTKVFSTVPGFSKLWASCSHGARNRRLYTSKKAWRNKGEGNQEKCSPVAKK